MGVFKHDKQTFRRANYRSSIRGDYFARHYLMTKGTKVLWCGFDPATVISIAGEWATIQFDDTKSITITNIKHLEEV